MPIQGFSPPASLAGVTSTVTAIGTTSDASAKEKGSIRPGRDVRQHGEISTRFFFSSFNLKPGQKRYSEMCHFTLPTSVDWK
jgi:hypothetical protein